MSVHCLYSTDLRRFAGSLGFSLGLPVALALCILVGPNLGLPPAAQTGDCRRDVACEEANLGRDIPATPRPDTDAIRIHCAWVQYHLLVDCRRKFQACLRSAYSAEKRRLLQNELAEWQDDYRCVYQEVTPLGRRQAHLPDPDNGAFMSQAF